MLTNKHPSAASLTNMHPAQSFRSDEGGREIKNFGRLPQVAPPDYPGTDHSVPTWANLSILHAGNPQAHRHHVAQTHTRKQQQRHGRTLTDPSHRPSASLQFDPPSPFGLSRKPKQRAERRAAFLHLSVTLPSDALETLCVPTVPSLALPDCLALAGAGRDAGEVEVLRYLLLIAIEAVTALAVALPLLPFLPVMPLWSLALGLWTLEVRVVFTVPALQNLDLK